MVPAQYNKMLQVNMNRALLTVKRALFIWKKRPYSSGKRSGKETSYEERDLLWTNETYSSGKRDLLVWQKRPTDHLHCAKSPQSSAYK